MIILYYCLRYRYFNRLRGSPCKNFLLFVCPCCCSDDLYYRCYCCWPFDVRSKPTWSFSFPLFLFPFCMFVLCFKFYHPVTSYRHQLPVISNIYHYHHQPHQVVLFFIVKYIYIYSRVPMLVSAHFSPIVGQHKCAPYIIIVNIC